ncbi:hypothetical protein BDW22DRAFT_499969 [Trametopsis cervina]|nr:hypothetical protein BDW22DRAFT_499969 [Trametopsis cervina]
MHAFHLTSPSSLLPVVLASFPHSEFRTRRMQKTGQWRAHNVKPRKHVRVVPIPSHPIEARPRFGWCAATNRSGGLRHDDGKHLRCVFGFGMGWDAMGIRYRDKPLIDDDDPTRPQLSSQLSHIPYLSTDQDMQLQQA